MEEVKNQPGSKNFYLSIVQLLKQGARPSQICKLLGLTKQALNYYLSSLKQQGIIRKIGYGVWEVLSEEVKNQPRQEVKKSTWVAKDNLDKIFTSLKPDSVRGHAFMFHLKLPSQLRNWERRAEILSKHGIPFKELKLHGGGQSLIFKGRKVWLTSTSIIIYEKSSYMAKTAPESKQYAIYDFLALVKSLETFLGADFSQRGKYLFKVSRQHYSLVKNALAQQYDSEGKKLHVYNASGLWFLIDNSFNLHEAETVHPQTADQDNVPVQDFFNGLKEMKGFTPQFVTDSLGRQAMNIEHYAIHLKSHVESVQKLGNAVEKLTELVVEKLK